MDIEKDQVCVLIPTLNEEPTIGDLIRQFISLGYRDVLVIDGKSTDRTREIATAAGARVVVQTGKGKGNAFIQALTFLEKPYILLLDGDGTYDPEDAVHLLNPLGMGFDQSIGNRLVETNYSSFHRLNLTGNRILNWLFKVAHGRYLYDILSGYRAFTLSSLRRMHLYEEGFGIETEISSEAVKNKDRVAVIPVQYGVRVGSVTKLDPIHDGVKIGRTIYRLAKLNNPIFYFGLIGALITLCGVGIGIFIVTEWFKKIDHIPLTILAMLLVIAGLQIFMFGIQSDMLLAYQREMLHEIQNLRDEVGTGNKSLNE
ncbi:MAG: S-layer glycoprotein N-glycosyltransferase AglJ [Methanospirillum sp.]|uniref:S-layer glycoprotein N-glycosyltransferase AglJ n=1 Tax=Methanospirillum sp. TaxID=45200 RepID=UPI00236BAFC1|nr:S-layer glycoprotein N-glycosyltransferase AglJ [Methanospirillum sp.]MDD1728421.1 S-layer glycoprotein N-glycosyltransferase AglJ [Methanospirillum sp.]